MRPSEAGPSTSEAVVREPSTSKAGSSAARPTEGGPSTSEAAVRDVAASKGAVVSEEDDDVNKIE